MTNNPFSDLTIQQLKRAVVLKEQIEQLEEELARVLESQPRAAAPRSVGRPRKKRTMSAAARARIAAGQRARWARIRRSGPGSGSSSRPGSGKARSKRKGKRTMSAAAKARIAASQKARWARIKAAKGRG